MNRAILRFVHRVADDPRLNLCSGIILLLTGLLETAALVVEDALGMPIGAHHGVALFGFLQVIKALPDTMRGLKFVEEGEESLLGDASGGAANSTPEG
jgi:hypothetical protein